MLVGFPWRNVVAVDLEEGPTGPAGRMQAVYRLTLDCGHVVRHRTVATVNLAGRQRPAPRTRTRCRRCASGA
ncbi:MAG: hypothetical protein AAFQ43_00510 [Bacteroidota bacterium]